MSDPRLTRRDQLEAVINRHKRNYLAVCEALEEINHEELYKFTHKNFESYCRERLGFSRIHAYGMISYLRTVRELQERRPDLPMPHSYDVSRRLNGLDPDTAAQVWEKAVACSTGAPTSSDVFFARSEVELASQVALDEKTAIDKAISGDEERKREWLIRTLQRGLHKSQMLERLLRRSGCMDEQEMQNKVSEGIERWLNKRRRREK